MPAFHGSIVALATPFAGAAVDEPALRRLVDHQIACGTDGLVPCGTTGESPTLSHAEHKRVVELCIEQAAGRVPVIAGAGSNNTAEALDFMRHAEDAGADAALVVTPYYNKPTQDGLYAHYMTLAEVGLPIVIYNIPGRSVIDMSVETMGRLSAHPMIVGVKDATADLARPRLQRAACGADFIQLSGEDATAVAFLAQGGHGCISVTANVAPKLCADMQRAWRERRIDEMSAIDDTLTALHAAMFCESNPTPVKYALSKIGICAPDVRSPLAPLSDASKAQVDAALKAVGLID